MFALPTRLTKVLFPFGFINNQNSFNHIFDSDLVMA